MIKTKLYLYDSSKADYKGTDYSANIKAGDTYTDDLSEVLDTADITLVGLTTSKEFAPTTKFIMEKYDVINGDEVLYDTYHLCVMEDVVSQPILSDNNYFNHAISFIEASVIAQGRMVDDMTLTYELKDVSINVAPTFDINAPANPQQISGVFATDEPNGVRSSGVFKTIREWKTTRRFDYDWSNSGGSINDWKSIKKNILNDSNNPTTITLPIPLITTQIGANNSTSYDAHKNYCSVVVNVYKKALGSDSWSVESGYPLQVNPSTSDANENDWQTDYILSAYNFTNSTKGYGSNRYMPYEYNASMPEAPKYGVNYKKFAEFDNTIQNRSITLTLDSGYTYRILVNLANFNTAKNELGLTEPLTYVYGDGSTMGCLYSYVRYESTIFTHKHYTSSQFAYEGSPSETGNPCLAMNFNVYEVGSTQSYQFTSAPPVSAYDLFIDAQLKSQLTMKQSGVYIKDMALPYYCTPDDTNALKNTQVVESAFHQKNFWEILLEIGKYIHAIPYIEFGENDRFLVRWRYLGQTDQAQTQETTISIFNSRSVENYVGALSSYVNNIMQLGGQIDEWTCAKSESDDYLVYNDVAKVFTSKPIMQIDKFEIKCIKTALLHYYVAGTQYDATDYIFEKNVYDLLDVTEVFTTNKGKAVYYRLGENVIDGLTYQLPNVNNGDTNTDYAIKRIIGTLWNITPSQWTNIMINDFAFHIVYRTKENTRSEQSRPDLRKYLINSGYEKIPHHKQFNNQQDKMVDSVKFGNQNYGKLIRTGNTEIKTTEWNSYLGDLKIAGQLVNIRGNIYYVVKAVHTFYQDHITSEITYSMDYNKLSEIIGIPSAPRFYEISEQNIIERHTLINDMLFLSTRTYPYYLPDFTLDTPHFVAFNKLSALLMGNVAYPKYAITSFTDDSDNPNPTGFYFIDIIKPISAYSMRNTLNLHWKMVDNFSAGDKIEDTLFFLDHDNPTMDSAYARLLPVQYVDKYGRAELMRFAIIDDIESAYLTNSYLKELPISPYRLLYNNITGGYGGQVASYDDYDGVNHAINPYTDTYVDVSVHFANSKLYDGNGNEVSLTQNAFYMVDDGTYIGLYYYEPSGWGLQEGLHRFMLLPSGSDIQPIINYLAKDTYVGADFAITYNDIALVKDCREQLAFNYNIQMLTDSDRFVLSGYLWQQNKGTIKLALLNTEVNKIINDTIPAETIIGYDPADELMTYLYDVSYTDAIQIKINDALSGLTDEQKSEIKAIALVSTAVPKIGNGRNIYFTMARNVSDLSNADKIVDWYIHPTSTQLFEKQ